MMEGLKPYANLKNSNVPWLGDVPAHWEVRRLKHSARLNPSKTEASSELSPDDIVSFLPMECVSTDGHVHNRTAIASSVWSGFTYFRRADVLVAKITPCFENGKGACLDSLETEYGFGSTEFHVLRASEAVLPKFLYRITTLPDFRTDGADAMNGAAGQQRVPVSFVANYPIALPPISEQSSIVRFLDHADRKIRRYIRAKQKLIKLLEEQKQAIIHRAVTRGLDPNVRLKPSGVEWLGDVPEHWEVVTLGRIARSFRTGPFGSILHQSEYIEGGIPLVNPTHMYQGSIRENIQCSVPEAVATRLSAYRLEVNDVVFARRGALGRCALVRDRESGWLCGTGSIIARFNYDAINPHYLIQALQVKWIGEYLSLFSVGATMDNLNTGILKMVPLLLPPKHEQSRILTAINQMLSSLSDTVDHIREGIQYLTEFRTRLIADVVTGKLDVREAAARLEDVEDASDEQDETAFDASLDDTDADADDDAMSDEEA